MATYTCFTCGEAVLLKVGAAVDHAQKHLEELYALGGLRYDPLADKAVPVDKASPEYLNIMKRVEGIQARFGLSKNL